MYSLKDFEPYTLQKHLGQLPVLVWSKKNGYHFLSFPERIKAELNGDQVNIVGVPKK